MIQSIGPAGTDHAEVIHMTGGVGKPIRYPKSGLPVLFPLSGSPEQRGAGFTHSGDDRAEGLGKWLTRKLVECRFGIKGVEVTWAAFHEKEDDALSGRGVVGTFGSQRRDERFGRGGRGSVKICLK